MNSDVTVLGAQISLLWVVIGAAMVIFMQAGFALVETGFCRAKHAAHVVSTNFAVFGLGFVAFFFVGFPLAFGGFSYGAMGLDNPVGEALIGSAIGSLRGVVVGRYLDQTSHQLFSVLSIYDCVYGHTRRFRLVRC